MNLTKVRQVAFGIECKHANLITCFTFLTSFPLPVIILAHRSFPFASNRDEMICHWIRQNLNHYMTLEPTGTSLPSNYLGLFPHA